jgi:hypothetical protein
MVLFLAASAAWTGTTSAVTVKDSPGYYSTPDPESMSVKIGRRTNAPLVTGDFHGGAKSLDELGRSVIWTLHHTNTDSLRNLCISDMEFKNLLWREFPQSRPATGLTWVDAWITLYARLHAGVNHAMHNYGGRPFQFVRFESDSLGVYKNFKLHMLCVIVTRDDAGGVQKWHWLRAVAERNGRFKIFSTED